MNFISKHLRPNLINIRTQGGVSLNYKILEKNEDGIVTFVLIDSVTQTEAEIIPSIGNNLIRFDHQGKSYISVPPSLKQLGDQVSCYQYGSAILFPPNRIKDAKFIFNNKEYRLPKNEDPNHLHGELCFKEWEVIDYGADDLNGCYITSNFNITEDPSIMEYFPHSITFTFTYRLKEGKLQLSGEVYNSGEEEAPYALGFHPYFPIPKENEKSVILSIPATTEWPVSKDAFVQGLPEKTEFCKNINKGIVVDEIEDLSCWLVSLEGKGQTDCKIIYPDNGKSLTFQINPSEFPFMVIFKPDWSSAVSLEPYSYVTDAFNLPWSYEVTGAKGIKPGDKFSFHWSLQIESI